MTIVCCLSFKQSAITRRESSLLAHFQSAVQPNVAGDYSQVLQARVLAGRAKRTGTRTVSREMCAITTCTGLDYVYNYGNCSRALRREMNLPAKSLPSAEADFSRVHPAALA